MPASTRNKGQSGSQLRISSALRGNSPARRGARSKKRYQCRCPRDRSVVLAMGRAKKSNVKLLQAARPSFPRRRKSISGVETVACMGTRLRGYDAAARISGVSANPAIYSHARRRRQTINYSARFDISPATKLASPSWRRRLRRSALRIARSAARLSSISRLTST